MKRLSVTILSLLLQTAHAAAQEQAQAQEQPAPGKPLSLRAALTDDVIERAVRASLGEEPVPRQEGGTVFGADPYRAFRQQFSEAKKPSCWHPDALKNQPARIGPLQLGGIFALPHLGAAILRGKCQ